MALAPPEKGRIPTEIGGLTRLHVLDLKRNNLTGTCWRASNILSPALADGRSLAWKRCDERG